MTNKYKSLIKSMGKDKGYGFSYHQKGAKGENYSSYRLIKAKNKSSAVKKLKKLSDKQLSRIKVLKVYPESYLKKQGF